MQGLRAAVHGLPVAAGARGALQEDGDLPAQATALRQFIAANNIAVLNVAAPRASGEPGIAAHLTALLNAALGQKEAG